MANRPLLTRCLTPLLREALADTPVLLLNGPRQAGKTTLASSLAASMASDGFRYFSLDDAATLLSAREDPTGFVESLNRAVIDEVQRAPELLLAIKRTVDTDRRPGRFLLTGSADLRTLPAVADSLAGRMEVQTLLPLAGCELEGSEGLWLEMVFNGEVPQLAGGRMVADQGDGLVERVLRGGYPEAVARESSRRRESWLRQYTGALLSRDVRDIAHIDKLEQLPRLLRALASMAGQLTNVNQLAGQVGLDHKTASKYLGVFEQLFLLRRIQPWWSNRLSRIVKTPKLHFLDSGLLANLLGCNTASLQSDRSRFGPLLESFVVSELIKLASWSNGDLQVLSYRDKDQREVDAVLENSAGLIVGVEVKAKASVQGRDFDGLRRLADLAGDSFIGGFVLYDGSETLPMSKGLWAVPLATLWRV
ncbi:ATP-binding protein [Cyanobium sp. HWJ4-Hawea]|uniref:ATP-binding protein n=1 Tax=Cyanobium sp. HWJ4-Hawea TaxID=2823713 RepID=UPI0020CED9C9|nr:ATP-binding protein [Cyanobium sp. HWJ4-Hawea]MCP9809568.1 ATP-binding protein [Cyanobium sp. HWJ4-Hawea]